MTNQEAYARGFCKAAAAAGVDPVALAGYFSKVAGDEGAGIGRYIDNSDMGLDDESKIIPYNPTSYVGRLLARHPGVYKGVMPPSLIGASDAWPEKSREQLVSIKDLERSRKWQADANARYLYPKGSVPYKRVYDNLMNAGRENYKSYLETGDTKERTVPNLQGIEKLKLTPEQKNQLLQMQNTMASKGVPRTGNIA